MNRLPDHWRETLAQIGVGACLLLIALVALYGRDVENVVRAWRLG